MFLNSFLYYIKIIFSQKLSIIIKFDYLMQIYFHGLKINERR